MLCRSSDVAVLASSNNCALHEPVRMASRHALHSSPALLHLPLPESLPRRLHRKIRAGSRDSDTVQGHATMYKNALRLGSYSFVQLTAPCKRFSYVVIHSRFLLSAV